MKMTCYCLDSHYNTVLQLFCYGGTNSTGSSDAGTKHLVATQKQCIWCLHSDKVCYFKNKLFLGEEKMLYSQIQVINFLYEHATFGTNYQLL